MYGANINLKDRLGPDQEDNAVMLMKFKGGQIGQTEDSFSAVVPQFSERLEVFGTKGSIEYPWTFLSPIKCYSLVDIGYVAEKAEMTKGLTFPLVEEYRIHGFFDMFSEFLNCIERNTRPNENFEQGYVVNEIIDAAYRSMRSRTWERVRYTL
jgi:predicted dehydrogenase